MKIFCLGTIINVVLIIAGAMSGMLSIDGGKLTSGQSMTLLASLLKPYATDLAMSYLTMVGSIMIFCIGLNMVFDKKMRVANLMPALIIAVSAAFLPI